MILKKFKKIVLFLCIALVLSNSAYAYNLPVPQELQDYGAGIYSEARAAFGRSFQGYCGSYVHYQLTAMNIFDGRCPLTGNGNHWYGNFENMDKTSGGYYVYREPGRNCLSNLAEKYGNDLSNIVISFPIQSGYSASYPGAGHAFIIYRLKDGIAYYSESFPLGGHPEGAVLAENAEDMIARYASRHGDPLGCTLLTTKNYSAAYGNSYATSSDSGSNALAIRMKVFNSLFE